MKLFADRFIVIIAIFATLAQPLFFSLMGLLEIEYEGSDSSPVYVIYIATIAILSLIFYFYAITKVGVLKKELSLLVIIMFLFALHVLWVIFDHSNTILISDFLIFFLLLGLPGFLSAATIIKLNLISQVIRTSEVAFLFIALGIIVFSVVPTISGIKVASLAGASYQSLSYYSAFTFGMLLVYTNQLPNNLRFLGLPRFGIRDFHMG